jgi:cell division protein FtsB
MRDDAQQRLNELTAQQEQLQSDIAKLQTTRGREEVLRDQYAVAKPGEEMMVIVEPERPVSAASSTGFLDLVHKFLPFW